MRQLHKELTLTIYKVSELPDDYRKLIEQSKNAAKGSYSPYSEFPVGAAVLIDDNTIISGSNQENAAYPSGLCAERTALFYFGAHSNGRRIKAIAVSVEKVNGDFPYPCGSCLQVMAEFQQRQDEKFDILLYHLERNEVILSEGVDNLLPFAFKKDHLK